MDNLASKISIDHRCSIPLGQQLYNELYRLILSKQIPAGTALPASRHMAQLIKISRSTVVSTYEQLRLDGYVCGEGRNGTRVLPLKGEKDQFDSSQPKKSPSYAADKLSIFAQSLLSQVVFNAARPNHEFDLYPWDLAWEELPRRLWGRELEKLLQADNSCLFEYSAEPRGLPALRAAIANHVKRSKGIAASVDQVLIVSGWQQALDLIVRIHLNEGDIVAVENPSYPIARRAFWACGAQICPIDVDEDGMNIDQLMKIRPAPKLVQICVSHQFPTGAILSASRRLQLLKWAAECDSIIIEDEHDSDFRYTDHPVPALKTLDRLGSVITQGTFAKSFFPALGLGFMIVPDRFIDVYSRAKAVTSEPVAAVIQQLVANLIDSGDFERHLKRMRGIYDERRRALLAALEKHLGKRVEVFGETVGVHIMIRLESRLTSHEIVSAASKAGVGLIDTSAYYFDEPRQREFVLGYSKLSALQIEEAIRRFSRLI